MFIETKKRLLHHYTDKAAQALAFSVGKYIWDLSPIEYLSAPHSIMTEETEKQWKDAIDRLLLDEPIEYIFSHTLFYGIDLYLNPHVLIPRPETEELISWIIELYKNKPPHRLLDLATGSGCIALSLKKHFPKTQVEAIDISEKALSVARKNSKDTSIPVSFRQGDILSLKTNIAEPYQIIVSNPPYVTLQEKQLMEPNVLNYEPSLALFVPDNDPLRFYKPMIHFATYALEKGGKLFFEINEEYGEHLVELFKEAHFTNVTLRKDINGKPRMIYGER